MAESLRIATFGGIIPRLADRGLPDNAAQSAFNAKLYSGELRAWQRMRALATLPIIDAKTVFHYQHLGADRFMAFNELTQVVKAPLINETLGRLYWTGSTGARINTTARIESGLPSYRLGVPSPTGVITVTPSGGTAATAESRVYVATLITAFGEESSPSSPEVVAGNADGTWTVTGLNTMGINTTDYPNITKLRLYRTLTSRTGVDYRQVAEWDIGSRPASYNDTVTNETLVTRTTMDTLGWGLPPAGLKGLISVAGGFLAGYIGRTVYLSVPYYPHSWPEEFQFAVEDDIVGLGTTGNSIVVCTKGRASVLYGQTPDVMALAKINGVQPCLSARSIVSITGGVVYASTDGLVMFDGSANDGAIISRAWVTKDEWLSRFHPEDQMASVYQDRYFAFYSSQLGFTVGFDDPITGFTELQVDGVSSVDIDTLTGQTLVTIGDTVYEWDSDPAAVLTYVWRSKPMQLARPCNMGAIQLRGSFTGSTSNLQLPPAQGVDGYAINSGVLNGPRDNSVLPGFGGSVNGPPAWMAMGEAPAPPSDGPQIATKVFADGVLVWTGAITDERMQRLPSGYKAHMMEVEVEGTSPLFSITLADTPKTLARMP